VVKMDEQEGEKEVPSKKTGISIKDIYRREYKRLLILPIGMLVLAIILIISQVVTTGDFLNKDVSLKGGVTITIPDIVNVDISGLRDSLANEFPNDIDVRALREGGIQSGIIVTSDIDGTDTENLDLFIDSIQKKLGDQDLEYSVEVIGSSLGASFFKEVLIALIIAFILMGIVVLIYFRLLIPGLAVILATLSDIIVTLAIVNLIGIKISSAGIAAFLMLIGYSVDTNILLSTKVLKRRGGRDAFEAIINAMKTGFMMTLTTIAALTTALIFSQSEIIRQIMIILLIGLLVDVINTWIGNSAILRMYLERKKKND